MAARLKKSSRTGSRSEGFTLLELLVVLVVMGILMGIGMPYFLRFSKQLPSPTKYTALYRDSRFIIGDMSVIEPLSAFYSYRKVVDRYHFDNETSELGEIFSAGGAEFVNGLVGKCLYLESGESIDLGNNPKWVLNDEGFYVELYVNIEELEQEVDLLKKENLFTISIARSGLTAFFASIQAKVVCAGGTEEEIAVDNRSFEYFKWVKIGLLCKRGDIQDPDTLEYPKTLNLYINDTLITYIEFFAELSDNASGKLLLLDGSTDFVGKIDELLVARCQLSSGL